jgi:hypothetical protein
MPQLEEGGKWFLGWAGVQSGKRIAFRRKRIVSKSFRLEEKLRLLDAADLPKDVELAGLWRQ